jgi:hypothetical protein
MPNTDYFLSFAQYMNQTTFCPRLANRQVTTVSSRVAQHQMLLAILLK